MIRDSRLLLTMVVDLCTECHVLMVRDVGTTFQRLQVDVLCGGDDLTLH